jgi:hypothetical protein
MKTSTASLSLASKLILAALLAAVPTGTGCVADVEPGEDEGADESALEDADECELGESRECVIGDPAAGATGIQTCVDVEGVPTWDDCASSSASTPLVLSFDGSPIEYVTAMTGAFDLSGMGATIATDWPAAATPWLAMDRDGDGSIGGGEELFGSATVLAHGARADNGFAALAELDADGDGWITPEDAAWSRLVLWSDHDADRASDEGELTPLAARGVTAIAVRYERAPRCDARRNCEIERAVFRYADGNASKTGAIVDVHLKWQ